MAFLIGFDKNRQNLEFRGHSKLSINFLSNYLYVEPENEEYKLISASFEWNYAMKKNLLFVFSEFDFLDFCLVFNNETICKKTLDYIVSAKKNMHATGEVSIDKRFIIPIFQKIAEIPTLNTGLIETIATWHQMLDVYEKERYLTLIKEYGIYDMIIAAVENQQIKMREKIISESSNNRKRKFFQIMNDPEVDVKKEVTSFGISYKTIPLSQFQLFAIQRSWQRRMIIFTSDNKDTFHEYKSVAKSRKNTFKCVKCEKKAYIYVNESSEICVKLDSKKKHSCKPSTEIHDHDQKIKFIFKPNYEIFENCVAFSKKVLVVYDSTDKSLCYEYFWGKNRHKHFCRGCYRTDLLFTKIPSAHICNKGTAKEYIELINENHVCKKRKFRPEKYGQHFANVFHPDFEIQNFCHNGKEKKNLNIFDLDDRTKCYQYYFTTKKKQVYLL